MKGAPKSENPRKTCYLALGTAIIRPPSVQMSQKFSENITGLYKAKIKKFSLQMGYLKDLTAEIDTGYAVLAEH